MTVQSVGTKRMTLNIDPVEAPDLLARVPRACVAFTAADGPQAEPVTVLVQDGRYRIGMPSKAAIHLINGQEAVLVVDDGVQFFDLRAIYVRGHIQPLREDTDPTSDTVWFEVQPTRILAWDYARIREVTE